MIYKQRSNGPSWPNSVEENASGRVSIEEISLVLAKAKEIFVGK